MYNLSDACYKTKPGGYNYVSYIRRVIYRLSICTYLIILCFDVWFFQS